jgi:hypothetical protein
MPKKLESRIENLIIPDDEVPTAAAVPAVPTAVAIPVVPTADNVVPSTPPNEEPTRKVKIIQKHLEKQKLLLD